MPVVACPCGHEQIVPKELVGLEVTCRGCGKEFTARDPDGGPARRRRGASVPVWAWGAAAGGLLVLVLLAGGGLIVANRLGGPAGKPTDGGFGNPVAPAGPVGPGTPDPVREGDAWTYQELNAHLTSRGVVCLMKPRKVYLLEEPEEIIARDQAAMSRAAELDDAGTSFLVPGAVHARKHKTAQIARDLGGMVGQDGVHTFSWGRFVFRSRDRAFLDQIKAALSR